MNRRSYLATAGVTVPSLLGGCLTPVRRSGDDQEPRADRSPSSTDASDVEGVDVAEIVVRKAVVYRSLMGSGGVVASDGRQYVVAAVRTNEGPEMADFTFRTDGGSWDPGLPDTAGGINSEFAGIEGTPVGWHAAGTPRSHLAFEVPSPLADSNPAIHYEGRFLGPDSATWPLPSASRDRLGAPAARFTLETVAVPAEIASGDPLPVSLTVRNVSETDGRFLAALYWPTSVADDDEAHVVERSIAATDVGTLTVEIPTEYTEGVNRHDDDRTPESSPVTLSIDGHVTAHRDVRVHE